MGEPRYDSLRSMLRGADAFGPAKSARPSTGWGRADPSGRGTRRQDVAREAGFSRASLDRTWGRLKDEFA
ncbi:hypothetical protein OOK36_02380 [Streptomyces sp. NBC_00365]|uniref:hypothetical protein n=1 Tax=Streptomyces sp. NBC_00365 TaxID=2975726 RepID=UPI00225738BE|nr:hypothetical protein [Streptomyces sp. NBC_00365]MCX5087759.1 hypothetical protein [Streptomyces sp. NBC_00365]